jgi:eukaryotic-like serine/threonine-protein kinase
MVFPLGTKVGDYQFIDVVDSNRDGVTYKVRNVPEQRFELLRVLSPATQSDPVRLERFQREAKILSRLRHPYVVSYCASQNLDGHFVLATELVEGTTLAERLEVSKIPMPDAIRYVWQLLEALECAHEAGVIHRDICPSKLILTHDGDIKLSGFSLARSTADVRLTQAGASVGSAEYMSPEQVQGTGELDARSDLYSLGVLLYELATGRRPFLGPGQFDIMLAHLEATPDTPSSINPAISPELDALILQAIAKDPRHRFQSARHFREALMQVPLAAVPENTANLEAALLATRKKEKEKSLSRQTQNAIDDNETLPSHLPPAPPPMQGFPRRIAFGLITAVALLLFFLINFRK